MSDKKFDTGVLLQIVTAAFKEEFVHLKDELTEEQQQVFKDTLVQYAEQKLALAMASDEEEKEVHRSNLDHLQSAMKSLLGIAQIKSYDSAISLTGRILAGVLLATGKSLIPG